MKNLINIHTRVLLGALLMIAASAVLQARLGETVKDTDARYGKPTFAHEAGGMAFRSYEFRDRKIEVVFMGDEAVHEVIYFGPQRVYTGEQARKIGDEIGRFMRGLLTGAYGFSDEVVTTLLTALSPRGELVVSEVTAEGVTATYIIQMMKLEREQVYEALLVLLADKALADETHARVMDIRREASHAKATRESQREAGGF